MKQPPRQPCMGAVHVTPVPAGMTSEQVWEETTTLGHLARKTPKKGLTWAVMECPGGQDCRCQFIDRSPNWRKYLNDRLIAARVLGVNIPGWLLPVVAAFSRRP